MPGFINPAFEGATGKSALIGKIQKLSYAGRKGISCTIFSKLLASVQSGLVSALFFFNIQFMDSVKTRYSG